MSFCALILLLYVHTSASVLRFAEVDKAQLKRKAQLLLPLQLQKLRCVLIFYFETLWKLHCVPKFLKFVVL